MQGRSDYTVLIKIFYQNSMGENILTQIFSSLDVLMFKIDSFQSRKGWNFNVGCSHNQGLNDRVLKDLKRAVRSAS